MVAAPSRGPTRVEEATNERQRERARRCTCCIEDRDCGAVDIEIGDDRIEEHGNADRLTRDCESGDQRPRRQNDPAVEDRNSIDETAGQLRRG